MVYIAKKNAALLVGAAALVSSVNGAAIPGGQHGAAILDIEASVLRLPVSQQVTEPIRANDRTPCRNERLRFLRLPVPSDLGGAEREREDRGGPTTLRH